MTVRIPDPAELFQLLPTILSRHHVILITADGSQASAVALAAWAATWARSPRRTASRASAQREGAPTMAEQKNR